MNQRPPAKFTATEIEAVEQSAATTAGIMDLAVPVGVRVALTVLRKLYLQRGTARKKNAFSRGIDASAKRLVVQSSS